MASYNGKLCTVAVVTWGLTICMLLQLVLVATDNTSGAKTSKDLKLFQKLFEERRQEHKAAVRSLLALQDYAKQYKMIKLTLEKVFQVLESSQERLRKAAYIPGHEFPDDEEVRDALSQTLETTCLLGEIVLHLPDVAHKVLRATAVQQQQQRPATLLAWGVFFTAHSHFLPANTKKLVHLMSQELGLAEKDPDYINPYAEAARLHGHKEEAQLKPKKKRKTFKKGPMLSRHYGDL